MHLYKRLCPSVRRSVRPSVRPSVRRSVGHKVLFSLEMRKYDQKMVNACHIHCLGVLSVHSFVCLCVSQSVGPSIGPLVGSPAGPSLGWMHRCLPVRLVLSIFTHNQAIVPYWLLFLVFLLILITNYVFFTFFSLKKVSGM